MRPCVPSNPWITSIDSGGAPAIAVGVVDGSGIQDADGHVGVRITSGEGVV